MKQAPFVHSADTDRKALLAVLTPDLPVTTQEHCFSSAFPEPGTMRKGLLLPQASGQKQGDKLD